MGRIKLSERCNRSPHKKLVEGYTPEQMREVLKIAKEIGIKTLGDLSRFDREENREGDLLTALRRYRKDLGDDFKIEEGVLTEAESDYIRIGGKIYPKDMSGARWRDALSAEEVSREAGELRDAEIAAEEEERRAVREIEDKNNLKKQAEKLLDEIKRREAENKQSGDSYKDELTAWFDVLVPATGKATTVAGELIRAMMRLEYRDFNDGDVFYEGYGLESAGPAAAYIMKVVPSLEKDFLEIADNAEEEEEHTSALRKIQDKLLDFLRDNSDLLATENRENMFDYAFEDKYSDHIPVYDGYVSVSKDVSRMLEDDVIDSTDLIDYVQTMIDDMQADYYDIRYDGVDNSVVVTEIKRDLLDEIEWWNRNPEDTWESFVEDKIEEFPELFDEDGDYIGQSYLEESKAARKTRKRMRPIRESANEGKEDEKAVKEFSAALQKILEESSLYSAALIQKIKDFTDKYFEVEKKIEELKRKLTRSENELEVLKGPQARKDIKAGSAFEKEEDLDERIDDLEVEIPGIIAEIDKLKKLGGLQ